MLIELVCTYSNRHLNDIDKVFQETHKDKTLSSSIGDETSGQYKKST
jgi:hypothetical protein